MPSSFEVYRLAAYVWYGGQISRQSMLTETLEIIETVSKITPFDLAISALL